MGWTRIMKCYTPKWMVAASFLTAIVNSLSFPLLGLVVAKFQFILMKAAYDPDFVAERDLWIVLWISLCVLIGCFNGTERSMIGICGENLTFNVRKQTVRGIIFK